MFGIGFFKGQPTQYIMKYVGGKVVQEGHGLTFYYLRHKTSIVSVPTSSTDGFFVFNEVTRDFQSVTIQGQFTYRIHDPPRAASLLNFAIDARRRTYLSDEPERLAQRISNIIQTETRDDIHARTLEEALRDSQTIATQVHQRIGEGGLAEPTGVQLLNLCFLAVAPTPEVAKALEADYRESLLRKADEAVYARRAAAVENERTIKEKELGTDIALEQQRQQLVDLEGGNRQREAEYQSQVLEREAQARAKSMELEAGGRAKAMELEAGARAKGMELEAGARAKAMELEVGAYQEIEPVKILALAARELSEKADVLVHALARPVRQAPPKG